MWIESCFAEMYASKQFQCVWTYMYYVCTSNDNNINTSKTNTMHLFPVEEAHIHTYIYKIILETSGKASVGFIQGPWVI